MEDNLNVSVQGFNNVDTARMLGKLTLEAIRSLENAHKLDISKLKKIVISFDFSSALETISDEYNHKSKATFTNSKQAIAVAKLLAKMEDDGKVSEYTLLLSWDFFIEIFESDGSISLENISHVLHRLHHELIHIHEDNKNSFDSNRVVDDYDHAMLTTGMRAWSEYLANYMSSASVTDDSIINTLSTLEAVLTEVPLEIRELVFKYKVRQLSLVDMHFAVTERIKLIANMYGYAQGYIDGAEIDMDAHFPMLLEILTTSDLAVPLKGLGDAFLLIKSDFEKQGIHDFEVFNSASNAINELYKSFGLQIERSSDPKMGLYIHVV